MYGRFGKGVKLNLRYINLQCICFQPCCNKVELFRVSKSIENISYQFFDKTSFELPISLVIVSMSSELFSIVNTQNSL